MIAPENHKVASLTRMAIISVLAGRACALLRPRPQSLDICSGRCLCFWSVHSCVRHLPVSDFFNLLYRESILQTCRPNQRTPAMPRGAIQRGCFCFVRCVCRTEKRHCSQGTKYFISALCIIWNLYHQQTCNANIRRWLTCICLQVALGDVFESASSSSGVNIGSLPAGMPAGLLSVKGRGRFSPSPDGFETLPDGMVIQFSAHLL